MNKKLYAISLICLFLTSSLLTLPTVGSELTISSDKKTTMSSSGSNDYEEPEFWGVLVGSNPFPEDDGDWFITPTIKLKNVLCDGGWKEDNIKLLIGQVTKREIFDALSWLEENARPIDTVLIYLHDHGLENNFVISSPLLNFTVLWYRELDRKLDRIDCAGMAIIISACQSGTAIEFLRGYKRVIMTSSDIDTHVGFADNIIEDGLKGEADIYEGIGNSNGYVSIEELYKYYVRHQYYSTKHPRFQDEYRWDLSLTFHNLTNEENQPPYAQLRPVGPTTGKKNTNYTFYISAEDYEGDQIYYKFDWDDGEDSGWIGPYNSGEICETSHKWPKKGSYHIEVETKCDNFYRRWQTDTLRIDIARSKFDIKLEEFFDEYRGFYDIVDELFGWNIGH